MGKLSFKTRAKRARAKLESMGVVFAHDSWVEGEYSAFAISGEDEHGDWSDLDNHPEKALIVDYYHEFGTEVSSAIVKVLKHYGLYFEWVNAGVLGVYDE